MNRRLTSVVLLVAVVCAACGAGGGRTRDRRTVTAALGRMSTAQFSFTYREDLVNPPKKIEVRGEVADDLRSSSTLAIDGRDVLQQVVSDDAVAIRVLNQGKATAYVAEISRENKEAATALKAGMWVVDHQGAPELVAPRTSDNVIQVGANPLLDASSYIFQYVEESMNASAGVGEFNPDDVAYNPLDDPWSEDAEADLIGKGIRRYDIGQPPLPRPTQRGTGKALPGTPHFRKMVFYLKGQRLTELNEQILISDRAEFRRAASGRAAQYYLTLRGTASAGATRDVVRERTMAMSFEPKDDVQVALPGDDFVSVPAMDLLAAVSALIPSPTIRRGGGPLPSLPAPSTPGATGVP